MVVVRPRRRWPRVLFGSFAFAVALLALSLVILDSDIGHRFVANRIAALRPSNGLRYSVGRIDGSLFGQSVLVDVRVRDPQGLVFQAPRAELDWSPFAWLSNRLDITRLSIPRATLVRLPHMLPVPDRGGPILPDFNIHIGELRVDRLTVGEQVTGTQRIGRIVGRADVRAGRALVQLAASVAGSDRLQVALDAEPDRDRFDLELHARGAADGVLAAVSGIRRPLALDIGGDGSWTRWRGTAVGAAGGVRIVELSLGNAAGTYSLTGMLAPASLTSGKLQRLSAPRVQVNGTATLADRQLAGRLELRSAALALNAVGTIDLSASALRDVRVAGRLLQPPALFPNMTGNDIELRAMLDGAFATARFSYRLTARRFAFDNTGFEQVMATGGGQLSGVPVSVPVRFTAARVTGIGDVAGGILRNLSVSGVLRVTSRLLTGDDLQLRSDKLTGRINLTLDLVTGQYEVGVNGALGRYLIPGLGMVDVRTTLRVVPGEGGHGTRVIGRGEAQMVRLDNAFFRSLAGGLPHVATGLERAPDGTLYLRGLVLTAPSIRIDGNGLRRRDGTFHFEGAGRQASYGPFTIRLDGDIGKPTLDLVFQRPNATLGLTSVAAHLDPTPQGFAFTARGGSRLGPFTAQGAILLPPGGAATIQIGALDVAGTHGTGAVNVVSGGFDGRLALSGGGIAGPILFQPVNGIQRIEAHLDLTAARFNGFTLRRGHVDFATLLDPRGTQLELTAQGAGLRRGAFVIGRFAANAHVVNGSGELRASIAGTAGRSFDIQTVTRITPDRLAILASGTLDRRPLQLVTPAMLTADGDGWRLAPTRLTFSGGAAQLTGRLSGSATELQGQVAQLSLSILDIGFPGLGLGGSASGSFAYAASGAAQPTGRLNLTIRGLTRSGLVLSSQPVDVGVAALLQPGRLATRAVVASGGRTVGRAQALLTLGPGEDLPRRIAAAQLFAQLRYAGPADTLWRLTRVELFDLTGPVAIGADVTGSIAHPQITGAVQANGARIESATTGTVLTNVQANGRFDGSRLALDRLTADAGRGGHVTGGGAFDFSGAGIGIDLRLQADHAVLIDRDDIGATVSGPLTFRSTGQGGTIAGNLVLDRSRYRMGQATAASAVPQLNVREINLPGGGEEDDAPATPWRLDVHARAPNGLNVSGLGLSSEWSADLAIGGAPDNPAIRGRADLIRGDYQFAGREFQLSRGVILFDGAVPANPSLDIAADANTSGLNATIRVTGPALRPEISFASVPTLPEDELLSRLLFGTSITNLSAPEALQLASAVAALNARSAGLDPINAVRRAAGLDRLRFLPPDPQTGAGTAVAAGKYVTRRLYAEIVTDGAGYSATQLEFQVTRWLSILSSISTLGRTSANVRVSRDY